MWEDDKLWQWRFTIDSPDFRPTSEIVDMSAFHRVEAELKKAELLRATPGSQGYAAYVAAARSVYDVAEVVRAPIRERLLRLHAERKPTASDAAVVVGPPPRLSYFESYRVRDHEFETRFIAEPMFYRSCLRHVQKAQELLPGSRRQYGIDKLLDVYEERAGAIIMAAACLEAYVNGVLRSKHEELWKSIETLSPPGKWHLVLALHDAGNLWKPGEQPIQTLLGVNSSRNDLLHSKGDFRKAIRNGGRVRTRLDDVTLSEALVDSLPHTLRELVEQLATVTGDSTPEWLNPSPSWNLPSTFAPASAPQKQQEKP